MITLELFCGTKSFSKVAKELGHKTFTVDIDSKFNPDLICDIMDFKVDMLPEEFRHPDVVWASPPCTTFSVASLRHYWENGKPKNEKALHDIEMVKKTWFLLCELNPKFWFIENPRGMLRKQEVMTDWVEGQGHKRVTVTYCQYGSDVMKPTDIWTNLRGWEGRRCKNRASCHQSAKRGSDRGTQSKGGGGKYGWVARTSIPPGLFKELFVIINTKTKEVKK